MVLKSIILVRPPPLSAAVPYYGSLFELTALFGTALLGSCFFFYVRS